MSKVQFAVINPIFIGAYAKLTLVIRFVKPPMRSYTHWMDVHAPLKDEFTETKITIINDLNE